MKRTLIVMLIALSLLITAGVASAEEEGPLVEPSVYEKLAGSAEAECAEVDCNSDFAYKIDEWGNASYWGTSDMNGTYTHAGNSITITNSDADTFSWASEYPVCAVIVKGGPNANVYYYYVYEEPVYGDTGLTAPFNEQSGKTYNISHVTFCFNKGNGNGGIEEIPEFPTVALPIAAILGLAFFFQRRKE
jgi:hypothetical protein